MVAGSCKVGFDLSAVILSGARISRSEVLAESKDPPSSAKTRQEILCDIEKNHQPHDAANQNSPRIQIHSPVMQCQYQEVMSTTIRRVSTGRCKTAAIFAHKRAMMPPAKWSPCIAVRI